MAKNNNEVTGWVGWAYFAGTMMWIVGIFQAIAGLVALLSPTYYLVGERALVTLNYTTWGWIHLVLGVVLITAGSSVMRGGVYGRLIGVMLAVLSMVANFIFIAAYPIWSIIMIIVSGFIIYALTVHGAEASAD